MQVSANTSAMQMPATQNMSASSNGAPSGSQQASSSTGSNQPGSPLNDMMETGKELAAALMMSVLFGETGNDEESKESDPMAMMLMAAGANMDNNYTATGDMQSGSSTGQNLNVSA
ncbi:MAG: hypothetical protein JKX85_08415 [Phycisphaeraceae bacterium]|nr:hypothetical protein [Phycisphaeraceae bacterium]